MGRRLTAGLLATVTAAAVLTAVPAASGAPPAEPRAERRPPTEAQLLDRALRRVERAGAVGAVAQVVDRGDTWQGAVGDGRLRPVRPAVASARFRAASVTKQLTTVLALQLVERGRWTLDTTIADVLPGLWPERGGVTLGQLLSHTSGMPDHVTAMVADATTPKKFVRVVSERRTDRALVRRAQRMDWLFEPGTDYTYSNTGFVVVGMMLRRATGRPLQALMRDRVLEPAGMTRSRFATDRRLERPNLHEYAALGRPVDLRSFSPTMFSSAGALISTARDLNRFQWALSSGRLVDRRLVREMRSVVTGPAKAGYPYGYGSFRLPDPCRRGRFVHGHNGATWGTQTLSFSSADGRRRVSVALTGRQYTARQPAYQAMLAFVGRAFATTCRGEVAFRSPGPAVHDLLPRGPRALRG